MNSDLKAFFSGLEHSRKSEIVDLTKKITEANPGLQSEIKWNAPSFKLNATNIITLRIFPDPAFQVILHVGAKKLSNLPDLRFEITHLQHRWADSTRCVITIGDTLNWLSLSRVLKKWVKQVQTIV